MAKLDLAGYLEDDALEVPGVVSTRYPDGKTYRVPSPDARTGLRLEAMVNLGVKARLGQDVGKAAEALNVDDDEERDLYQMVMGAAYDEMITDGVSWVRIQRLGKYLLLHFTMGEDAAQQALQRGALTGEAQAPNRATRRASKATAKSTPRRGSTAGTKPRPKRPVKA